MKLRLFFISLVTLPVLCTTTGCTTLSKMDYGGLVTGGRDGWALPEQVLATLEVKPGDQVAEIGAGGGYWLPFLVEAVGETGTVYAVEVTDELVAELHERVEREGWGNVTVVRGEFHDPMLPDGEIDIAMTSNTYHHIEGRPDYFRRLQADLAPGGRVVHVDDRHDVPPPFRWLQGNGHWTVPEDMKSEMQEAGYSIEAEHHFLPMQSFMVFLPATESS